MQIQIIVILDIRKPFQFTDKVICRAFRINKEDVDRINLVKKIIYHHHLQGLQEIKIAI